MLIERLTNGTGNKVAIDATTLTGLHSRTGAYAFLHSPFFKLYIMEENAFSGSLQERNIFTPSALNRLTRDLLEDTFPLIWIEGEISNFSRPASGHLYFTLKDSVAQVRCALFKPKAMYLRFKPIDGMHVLARARVSLYEGRGEFQLIVEHLEEAGTGALQREFEKLKARLAAEGLFDIAIKRPLPRFPQHIAIITSSTGAAVRDVLAVVKRRFPLVEIDIFSVPVQGENAAPTIITALQAVSKSARYDVVLLTRGGGSLEDLWAFNDETLARAIRSCSVPVVAAIGHEIDFTIAEFSADLRAPTPSAAAELLVPNGAELIQGLYLLHQRLQRLIRHKQENRQQHLDHVLTRLNTQRPHTRLIRGTERLRNLRQALQNTVTQSYAQRARTLEHLNIRLETQHPRKRIKQSMSQLASCSLRLRAATGRRLEQRAVQLSQLARTLNAVSPLATLERGYTILFDTETGRIIRSVTQSKEEMYLKARLIDGEIALRVL